MATKVADVYANLTLVPNKVKNEKVLKDMENRATQAFGKVSPMSGKGGSKSGAVGGGLASIMGAGMLASLFNPVTAVIAGIVATIGATLALVNKGLSEVEKTVEDISESAKTYDILYKQGFQSFQALNNLWIRNQLSSGDLLDVVKELRKSIGELTTSPTSRKALLLKDIGVNAFDSTATAFEKVRKELERIDKLGRGNDALKFLDEIVGGITNERYNAFIKSGNKNLQKEQGLIKKDELITGSSLAGVKDIVGQALVNQQRLKDRRLKVVSENLEGTMVLLNTSFTNTSKNFDLFTKQLIKATQALKNGSSDKGFFLFENAKNSLSYYNKQENLS